MHKEMLMKEIIRMMKESDDVELIQIIYILLLKAESKV
jgi:hypothetical protein